MIPAAHGVIGQGVRPDGVYISDQLVSDSNKDGTKFELWSTPSVRFEPNGQLTLARYNSPDTDVYKQWLIPLGTNSTYEVKASLVSGPTPTNGAGLDTWYALGGSTVLWGIERETEGTTTTVLSVSIREGTTTLGTALVTLEAIIDTS